MIVQLTFNNTGLNGQDPLIQRYFSNQTENIAVPRSTWGTGSRTLMFTEILTYSCPEVGPVELHIQQVSPHTCRFRIQGIRIFDPCLVGKKRVCINGPMQFKPYKTVQYSTDVNSWIQKVNFLSVGLTRKTMDWSMLQFCLYRRPWNQPLTYTEVRLYFFNSCKRVFGVYPT